MRLTFGKNLGELFLPESLGLRNEDKQGAKMKSFSGTENVERALQLFADVAFGWPWQFLGGREPLRDTVSYRPVSELRGALSPADANHYIRQLISSPTPTMIGRLGSTELRAVTRTYLRANRSRPQKIYASIARLEPPMWTKYQYRNLETQSGFFPTSRALINSFVELMIESMSKVDLLGSWVPGENVFAEIMANAKITELESLEPFHVDNPWTEALAGRKILVIHPFARTITEQFLNHREKLFPGTNILPEFEIDVLEAVQSLSGPVEGFATWFDALEFMFDESMKREFDVAILGCGAYGFPLAAKLKDAGKKAIHLGGVTQILFGIKGKRWDSRPSYSGLYNDYWKRPSAAETPVTERNVDGGVYW